MDKKNSEIYLVVGVDGLIGHALFDYLTRLGKHVIGTTRRKDSVSDKKIFLDLSQDVHDWKPPFPISVAYFCAGITSIEECRTHPQASLTVNVNHTFDVVTTLVSQGAFVLFPSTNLVYDGYSSFQQATQEHTPLTQSGQLKAAAEKKLLTFGDSVSIVRITKVFGPHNPLLQQWISCLKQGQEIHPFSDKVLSPLQLSFVVDVFYQITQKRLSGITQISGEHDITYADFAYALAQKLNVSPKLVHPITSQQSGLFLENNPVHTTLDCTRLLSELHLQLPPLSEAVNLIIEENIAFSEDRAHEKL